jgi:two-component sensor histidine kinase
LQLLIGDVIPALNQEQERRLWDQMMTTGQQSGEYILIRKDSSTLEIEYQAVSNIIPGIHLSIHRDISMRKAVEEQIGRSLQEKRLLLQEVHHRVKNNLQLISSMLSLHADTIQDESIQAIFTESKRRIRSLALIHEELYRSEDFTGVHFDRHIRNLIDYLFVSYAANRRQIEFEHRGGNVALVVDRAIPCSLIVNELVSNALKHAFPAGYRSPVNAPARVWVALTWTAGEGHWLIIGDNGVGLPKGFELDRSASLGLKLVQALVKQLNGELSYENRNGAIFHIHFE